MWKMIKNSMNKSKERGEQDEFQTNWDFEKVHTISYSNITYRNVIDTSLKMIKRFKKHRKVN